MAIRVSAIRFTPAGPEDRTKGVLGWASCVLEDAVRLDGLAVRRTRADRRLVLKFPERRDRVGRAHPVVRPINGRTKRLIEQEVLGELRRRGYVP